MSVLKACCLKRLMIMAMIDSGFWLLNKPKKLSSAFCVRRIKFLQNLKKVGHAGTLDPLATGLLIVLVNQGTKLQSHFMELEKTYEFEVIFGITTPSFDEEVSISQVQPVPFDCEENLLKILPQFLGAKNQLPPLYSAVKKKGKALYRYVREGKEEEIAKDVKERSVFIRSLNFQRGKWITREEQPCYQAQFEVVCSKGTYVRALARDLAHALGTVGVCSQIKRTQIGEFHLKEAFELDDFHDQVPSLQTI